jgi:PAS domain S-box-containing protein
MSRAQGLEIELAVRLSAALDQISQAMARTGAEDGGPVRDLNLRAAATEISFALNHLAAGERPVAEVGPLTSSDVTAFAGHRLASSLIEAMPGVFYLYDEQGRFLRWNSNFETVSGYSAQEIAGMHPLDFFATEERALLTRRISEVFERGGATVEASVVSKQGDRTPYFFTGNRIELNGSRCLVGVGIDIAKRKQAEDALRKTEERYRSTLDTLLEGCQLIGFDWRYLYLNPAASVQSGRPNSELLGRPMSEVWPGVETTKVYAMLRRCMEERVSVQAETKVLFTNGKKGWFDVRAQPVAEGIFVLSADVTERRNAERALRDMNEGLERKVLERTRDLDAAKERAEAADRVKSAFLATMSHELRTPLNSILGFTGIILKGMAGPLTPEQSKQLGMVQGSARHLLALINDVLDISKIEAGQLEVRCSAFDLSASVARVTGSVLPLAEKKGLSLRVIEQGSLGPMLSDQRRFEQILLNLLNNAIKFTERGGVTLKVEVLDDFDPGGAGQAVRAASLRVSDTGIGMSQEDLGSLFQPFRQIDSGLQRQHEGTGLGLAICRRLTDMLGGTIHVESTLGQGSSFTAVLPLERRG